MLKVQNKMTRRGTTWNEFINHWWFEAACSVDWYSERMEDLDVLTLGFRIVHPRLKRARLALDALNRMRLNVTWQDTKTLYYYAETLKGGEFDGISKACFAVAEELLYL